MTSLNVQTPNLKPQKIKIKLANLFILFICGFFCVPFGSNLVVVLSLVNPLPTRVVRECERKTNKYSNHFA